MRVWIHSIHLLDERDDMSEASDLLLGAWAAVCEAGLAEEKIPAQVQAVALTEAVRMIRGDATTTTRLRPNGFKASAREGSDDSVGAEPGPSEDEFVGRIASNTGVSIEKLERVFYLDDGEPRIMIPGVKLGKNNADRTRATAQLLVVGRGYGLPEDETALDVIRAEVIRLKVYDSSNFASQLGTLATSGYVFSGSPKNRRWRAKSPAIEAFPKLVDDLLERAGQ
jgi:hypothetical protein